jgi:SecD/SecF fusion protein
MRNRGTIIFLSVLLALISLYYLSFTFVARNIEKKSVNYAETKFQEMGVDVSEIEKTYITDSLSKRYLDSVGDQVAYRLIKKYTYKDCKERELNLGLDLRGGMNITLDISAKDIVLALSNNKNEATLQKAIREADIQVKEQTGKNYIAAFVEAYNRVRTPETPILASLFISPSTDQKRISIKSTDAEVQEYLSEEYEAAIGNAFDVLRKRIDQFGVVQPNIQKDVAVKGVFHIELPGIKDPERVENLLKQAAVLEFWETYNSSEIRESLDRANGIIVTIKDAENKAKKNTEVKNEVTAEQENTTENLDDNGEVSDETLTDAEESVVEEQSQADAIASYSIFNMLLPKVGETSYIYGPVIGFAKDGDREAIMAELNRKEVKNVLPRELVFAWSFKPNKENGHYELIALKGKDNRGGAVLNGNVVTDATQELGQTRASAEVTMMMNSTGTTEWARITEANKGKSIAIVLDGYVYSFPTVSNVISNGISRITGDFTLSEATDLTNVLKSGKMPAPAHILSKEVVGPSLGQKAIDSGLNSFVIAFVLVMIYMVFYYGKAGLIADVALLSNILLIFGALAALGSVLTLPGIAGIVLTLGMAVDANVLIYERVREELMAGTSLKSAFAEGYRKASSAIIDSNLTTLIVGFVLLAFGVGPVKGFAVTLIIGILSSLFTAIFVTRLIFTNMLNKDKRISLGNKFTINAFQNLNINFIGARKVSYTISGIVILVCIISLFTRKLNPGIDFAGGRNYVVEFKTSVSPEAIADALEVVYDEKPVVKTYGADNQVKISTKYKIDEQNADELADSLLYVGLKQGNFIDESVGLKEFYSDYRQTSQKVGPTVADDIKSKSVIAVLIALIAMFLYILLRFKKWQYSLGALGSLTHNVIIVLGVYSLLYSIMPFNMEVDQSFIAAILTVIGYSINDTVVIFDRLREYLGIYTKRDMKSVMNSAINSTISRTINTSLSTLLVLIAIFLFGGEVIRGFIFAMLVGIIVGVYSSVFVATPISYDLMNRSANKKIKK